MKLHDTNSESSPLLCLSLENVPVELREPLYQDQYEQEHLKPAVSKLLLSPEIYCRAQALLAQGHAVSAPASQASPADNSALLQFLIKKGFAPKVQDVDVTEEDLTNVPIKTVSEYACVCVQVLVRSQSLVEGNLTYYESQCLNWVFKIKVLTEYENEVEPQFLVYFQFDQLRERWTDMGKERG